MNIAKIKDDYFLVIKHIDDCEKTVDIAAIVEESTIDDLVDEKITWEDIVNELDNIYYLAVFKEDSKSHLTLIKKLTREEIQENMDLIFTNHTLEL